MVTGFTQRACIVTSSNRTLEAQEHLSSENAPALSAASDGLVEIGHTHKEVFGLALSLIRYSQN